MCDHDINKDLISFLFACRISVWMYVYVCEYVALSQLVYSFYIEKRDRAVVKSIRMSIDVCDESHIYVIREKTSVKTVKIFQIKSKVYVFCYSVCFSFFCFRIVFRFYFSYPQASFILLDSSFFLSSLIYRMSKFTGLEIFQVKNKQLIHIHNDVTQAAVSHFSFLFFLLL